MIIEKKQSGLLITDIKAGQLIKQLYIGYSRKEAIARFKKYLKKH